MHNNQTKISAAVVALKYPEYPKGNMKYGKGKMLL